MVYPIFPQKYKFASFTSAARHAKARELVGTKYPKKYILCYSREDAHLLITRHFLESNRLPLSDTEEILEKGGIGLVQINGIGAPHTAFLLERLICLGGKEFISFGSAGGLRQAGLYLCIRAIRDEGTSYHYIAPGKYIYPDRKLTLRLARSLERRGVSHFLGTTWTIDAPYRETKREVAAYKAEGVATVEMEAAATFAIAKARRVKVACLVEVRDSLASEWKASLIGGLKPAEKGLLFEAVFDTLLYQTHERKKSGSSGNRSDC